MKLPSKAWAIWTAIIFAAGLAIGYLLLVMGLVVVFVLTMSLAANRCFGQQPVAPRQHMPSTPTLAVDLAAIEMEKIPAFNRPFCRMIWLDGATPAELDKQFIAVTATINMALNCSQVEYKPPRLAGNALVLVDFTQLVQDGKDLERLLHVWNDLFAERESFFHVHLPVNVIVKEKSGRMVKGKEIIDVAEVKKVELHHLPHPALGSNAILLEQYCGNPFPATQSYSPVVRADWFTGVCLSSIDGGLYLNWLGITENETEATEFLAGIGAPIKNVIMEAFLKKSEVTGGPRKIRWWYGSNVPPSKGIALNSITDDFFQQSIKFDILSGLKDPFLSPLDAKPDGQEIIFTKRNGWMGGIVANGKGKVVAEAPPNLVVDRTVPSPHPTRLHGVVSCARCHASNRFWQPIRDESRIAPVLDFAVVFDRHKKSGGNPVTAYAALFQSQEFADFRRLQLEFGAVQAEIDSRLLDARKSVDGRTFAALHTNADQVFATTADIYDEATYGPGALLPDGKRGLPGEGIDAITACRQLGFTPDPKLDPLGINTFRQVVPPNDPAVIVGANALFNRLTSTYEVPARIPDQQLKGKQRDSLEVRGMRITPEQWRRIFPDAYTRAMQIHMAAMKEKEAEQPANQN